MDKKNIILVLIAILVIFIVFSAFRPGITTASTYCINCKLAEDCQDYCYKECLAKGYDVVTSTGEVKDGQIMCDCKCESYLNNMIRGK